MWQEPLLHFKLTNNKVCVLEKIGGLSTPTPESSTNFVREF
jgi:hypothetical protein